MMMKKAIIISVLEQIEKNLEERIDIEKLVVITGYSRRSLQDFFKKSVESLSENISDNAS